jgi:hypothetical protein
MERERVENLASVRNPTPHPEAPETTAATTGVPERPVDRISFTNANKQLNFW